MNLSTQRMQPQTAVEQLYNQCRESGHCHVLLDPQAGSPFSKQIAALDEKLAPRIHLRDPLFADAPQEAPMLLRLPLSELTLLEALAVHAWQEATDPANRGGPGSSDSRPGFLSGSLQG